MIHAPIYLSNWEFLWIWYNTYVGVHTYMKTQKIVLVAELRTTHNQLMTSREEIRVVISVIFFFFFWSRSGFSQFNVRIGAVAVRWFTEDACYINSSYATTVNCLMRPFSPCFCLWVKKKKNAPVEQWKELVLWGQGAVVGKVGDGE